MSGDICRIPIRRLLGAVAAACLTVATGGLLAAPATAASDVNWDAVPQCESGGNWTINIGNGFYGGLQFTLSTWRANGGVGNPAKASRDSQITVAERVLVSQGIRAWPGCGKRSGNIVAATPRKPAKPATSVAPEPAPTTTGPTSAYTVLPGDTLWSIALSHHVPGGWPQLVQVNQGGVADPDLILVGQSLRIPL
ncbi:MAG: transglycosylase family protein [Pseudonocardiaceae bacterium]